MDENGTYRSDACDALITEAKELIFGEQDHDFDLDRSDLINVASLLLMAAARALTDARHREDE